MKISIKCCAAVITCIISCSSLQATKDKAQEIVPDTTHVERDKLLSMLQLECLQELTLLEKEQLVLIEQFNAKQEKIRRQRESALIMARRARIVIPIAVMCAYAVAYYFSKENQHDEARKAHERMCGAYV